MHEGETATLLIAMFWVVNLGLHFVNFESDSKLLVDAILVHMGDDSEFGSTVSNVRSLLLLNSNFVVEFVRR